MRYLCCLAVLSAASGLVGSARADTSDDFESYAVGSFPSPTWTDVRSLVPGSTAPDPSGRIISTTGPFGTTRAFQTIRAVTSTQGIVAQVAPAPIISISADVRYDRYDNSTNQNGGGWPLALGFFQWSQGNDPNFSPQVTLFSDSTTRSWSLYIQTSPDPNDFQFIRLTNTITGLNAWYRMTLQIDTLNGVITSQVRPSTSSAFFVNDTRTIPGWNPAFARYNIAGAIDGEYFTNATLGGQATVDNLTLTPGPGVSALGWLGLARVVRRRRSAGRVALGALMVASSAADGRDLLVSSRFSNTIIRYNDQSGALVGTIASGPELQNPNGIAYGPDGNLYVGLGDAGAVLRYNGQSGAFIDTFVAAGTGGLANVRDLAFGPDGNLYANSGTTNQVFRFNGTTGKFLGVAAQGSGITGPVGLAFGPDGSMYVGAALSNRVYRFANNGTLLRTYNPGALSNSVGVAIGSDGMLYAAMSVSNVVARFNPDTGVLLGTIGAATGLNIPIYMTPAPGGDLLVGSFGNDSVRRYDPATGAFRGVFITTGLGGLDGTHDIAFMPVPSPGAGSICLAVAMLGFRRRGCCDA